MGCGGLLGRAESGIWTKHLDSDTPLFRVVVGGKAGYIDREGRVVIGARFTPADRPDVVAGEPVNGAASSADELMPYETEPHVAGNPGRQGYRTIAGSYRLLARFASAGFFSEGVAPVAEDGDCYLAGSGGTRWPAPSTQGGTTSCAGLLTPRPISACRHGFIDSSGEMVIPAEFEMARSFREGRAAVRRLHRWGFIDREGKVAVRFVYDDVRDFRESLAAVRREGRWEYVNRAGETVIAGPYEDALAFGSGLAPVKVRGAWSYLDARGGTAIAGPFLQATAFVQGLAHVQLAKTKWAWIDAQGRQVFSYEWDAAAR
ncbi:MAG: WG repeat-containing protein [Bryobacterales bacterium]|nr:WG repeat-containing protein [Bryobacterales bacterium]